MTINTLSKKEIIRNIKRDLDTQIKKVIGEILYEDEVQFRNIKFYMNDDYKIYASETNSINENDLLLFELKGSKLFNDLRWQKIRKKVFINNFESTKMFMNLKNIIKEFYIKKEDGTIEYLNESKFNDLDDDEFIYTNNLFIMKYIQQLAFWYQYFMIKTSEFKSVLNKIIKRLKGVN
jgi:hypothetical protein